MSQGAADLYGVPPQRFVDDPAAFREVIDPEDREWFYELVARSARDLSTLAVRLRVRRADGTIRCVNHHCRPREIEPGLVLWDCYEVDVTAQHEAEEARRHIRRREREARQREAVAQRRLLDAIETLSEGFALFGADERLVMCNGKYREFYGLGEEQTAPGTHTSEILRALVAQGAIPGIVGHEEQWIAERLARHREPSAAFEQRLTNGRCLRVTERRTPSGDLVSVHSDVSELKAREAAVAEMHSWLDHAHKLAGLGFWVWDDRKNELAYASEEFAEIFGIPLDSFPKDAAGWFAFIHPEDREREIEFFEKGWQDCSVYRTVYRIVRPDGEIRHVAEMSEAITDASGRVVRTVGTLQDLSERRRVEETLQERTVQLRTVLDSALEGIIATDETGAITLFNAEAQKIFGYQEDEVLGRNVSLLMEPDDAARHDEHIARYLAGGVRRIIGQGPREVTARRKDGTGFSAEIAISECWVRGARGFVGMIRDLSQRKELERRARQTEKMQALGRLAGGMAHDFNNLLTPIIGLTSLVLGRLPEDSEDHRDLSVVLQAAERSRGLISQILKFSHESAPGREAVDLNLIVEEVAMLLRHTLPSSITIELHCMPGRAWIMGNSDELHQVMMNLGANAADAMGLSGGRLTIATELLSQPSEDGEDAGPRRQIRLTVSDTGSGMSEEVRQRAFDPFFTTKEVGEGTGLGLATVHGIVTALGGTIEIASELGRGTTFDIRFPGFDEAVRRRPAEDASARPPVAEANDGAPPAQPAVAAEAQRG